MKKDRMTIKERTAYNELSRASNCHSALAAQWTPKSISGLITTYTVVATLICDICVWYNKMVRYCFHLFLFFGLWGCCSFVPERAQLPCPSLWCVHLSSTVIEILTELSLHNLPLIGLCNLHFPYAETPIKCVKLSKSSEIHSQQHLYHPVICMILPQIHMNKG